MRERRGKEGMRVEDFDSQQRRPSRWPSRWPNRMILNTNTAEHQLVLMKLMGIKWRKGGGVIEAEK